MRLLRNVRLLGAIAIVAVIVAVALWPSATDVDVAVVARGAMQVTIDEEGETRVRERFVVSAPVAGIVERIELEPGDRVFRGKTVVARLMPATSPLIDTRTQAELRAAVEAARAAVGQAQAEHGRAVAAGSRAESTVRRLEALLESGAISRDELEAAQTTFKTAEEAATRQHTPKIAFVSPPKSYQASSGKQIEAGEVDLLVRALSMGKLHHAMMGTCAVAIGTAAAIPGTLVNLAAGGGEREAVRFGHPSGTLRVGAQAKRVDGQWTVTKAIMSRSARVLMEGKVRVPVE